MVLPSFFPANMISSSRHLFVFIGSEPPKLASALLLEGRPPCRPRVVTDRTEPVPPNASEFFTRTALGALVALACLLSPGGLMAGETWNATEDFTLSAKTGVNGVWSYGYRDTDGKSQGLMKVTSTGYFGEAFHAWSMDQAPCIARNESETIQHGVEPGRLAMHPGFDGLDEQALLVFTAPAAGTYNVALKFLYTGGGDGVVVSAIRNPEGGDGVGKETVFFSEELKPSLPDYEWTEPVELKAGEALAFAVGNGNANSNGGDSAVVELVISRKESK